MRAIRCLAFSAVLVCSLASVASAEKETFSLTARNLAVRTSDERPYYIVEFDLPEIVQTVRHAWLDLRVDVSSIEVAGFADPAPVFEVYALTRALSGELDVSMFGTTRVPMSRPVAAGTDRLVRIEITEFVQKIRTDPMTNHGIVLGELTGDRRGNFIIKPDGLGPGTPVQLTIIR